jgi:hypothetical protein
MNSKGNYLRDSVLSMAREGGGYKNSCIEMLDRIGKKTTFLSFYFILCCEKGVQG